MAQRRIDWDEIKTEYVTTDISQPKLIKKYKLSKGDVNRHSVQDGWVEARKVYREKMMAKTVEKFANKEATRRANLLKSLLNSSCKLADKIEKLTDDPDQFNKYIVQYGSDKGKFDTEERIYTKADTRAMKDLAQTIRNLEGTIRSIGNLPTPAEQQRLDLERQKFELEKEKWEREKAESGSAHEVRVVFDTDDLEGWTE